MTYKKATLKAGRFFKDRTQIQEATMQMIVEGFAPDDVNHVTTLLRGRYRQLKACLRARI